MIMKTTNVTKVNGVNIFIVEDEENQMIPIRPICDALGVQYELQLNKLKEHPSFGPTISQRDMVAADGKVRSMSCLPAKKFFGWIYTINPKNVSEEARESMMRYQEVCSDALYDFFMKRNKLVQEQNSIEISLLEELNEYTAMREEANKNIAATKRKIEKLREERLKGEPSLFD